MSWNDTKNTSAKKKRIFEEFCLPKFHSSPLKSYRNPLGKACLPTTILRGELLNFGGTLEDKRLEPTAITHEKKGKENDRSNQTSRECMFHVNLQWCIDLSVSENGGTPESSILIGFSIINHPFWGTPIFGNTHLVGRKTTFFSNFEKVHLQVCGALDNDSRTNSPMGKKNHPTFAHPNIEKKQIHQQENHYSKTPKYPKISPKFPTIAQNCAKNSQRSHWLRVPTNLLKKWWVERGWLFTIFPDARQIPKCSSRILLFSELPRIEKTETTPPSKSHGSPIHTPAIQIPPQTSAAFCSKNFNSVLIECCLACSSTWKIPRLPTLAYNHINITTQKCIGPLRKR